MAEMKYSTKITLYNSYFDLNDNLSAKSILSIFQDVASVHAEEIGVGFGAMLQQNFYWVLSRIKFDVFEMPKPNQTVIVETWPHEKGRIDFDRDLKISDKNGKTLIVGTSKWCVIDTVARRLQRAEKINYNGEICKEVNYQENFGKIVLPEQEPREKFRYKVLFSDLDHNQHMNNTNYANLVASAVNNKILRHFEINFVCECKENDEIVLSTIEANGEYVIGKRDDQIVFLAFVN